MIDEEADFSERLLRTFRREANGHIGSMVNLLQALAGIAAGKERAHLLEALFREVHSLKGAARAVDRTDIEAISLKLERSLIPMQQDAQASAAIPTDLFYRAIEALRQQINQQDDSDPH